MGISTPVSAKLWVSDSLPILRIHAFDKMDSCFRFLLQVRHQELGITSLFLLPVKQPNYSLSTLATLSNMQQHSLWTYTTVNSACDRDKICIVSFMVKSLLNSSLTMQRRLSCHVQVHRSQVFHTQERKQSMCGQVFLIDHLEGVIPVESAVACCWCYFGALWLLERVFSLFVILPAAHTTAIMLYYIHACGHLLYVYLCEPAWRCVLSPPATHTHTVSGRIMQLLNRFTFKTLQKTSTVLLPCCCH